MDVFIARQPIFNRQEAVYAYELLFRSGTENAFTHEDPDQASAKVMTDGSFIMGMEKLTENRPLSMPLVISSSTTTSRSCRRS